MSVAIRRRVVNEGIHPSPQQLTLFISGPREAYGSVRAGSYRLINLAEKKRCVASASEQGTYDGFYGEITWTIISGSSYVELNSSGSEATINILSSGTAVLKAAIGTTEATVTITANYQATNYLITSFADLRSIETMVNTKTESQIALTVVTAPASTPTNGGGFQGIVFRFASDIDCDGSHVEIGQYNTSKGWYYYFKGTIDGAFYRMYNMGGNCGVDGAASSGGLVGSALIGAGQGFTVQNMTMEGSVTNVSGSRGFGGWCAFYGETCTFRYINSKVNVVYRDTAVTATAAMIGWTIGSSYSVTVKGCYWGGEFKTVSGNQCSAGGNVSYFDFIHNCKQQVDYGPRNKSDYSIRLLAYGNNSYAYRCVFIGETHQKKHSSYSSTSNYQTLIRFCPYTYYCCEAGTITKDFSSSLTLSYYYNSISDSVTLNGFTGGTTMTLEQLKQWTPSSGDWITEQGWLRMPVNNPYIWNDEVLAKV